MAEMACDCKVLIVSMTCDKCKNGFMEPTGIVLTSYPAKYQHMCNKCGHMQNFYKNYPYQKLVSVEQFRELREDEVDSADY